MQKWSDQECWLKVRKVPISLDLRIHSGSETPLGQAFRAFLVCQGKGNSLVS
jgi:hypothetical protein